MKDKPFGLDIGATSLKTVWLGEQKEGFILRTASVMPSVARGIMSESPLDQEEMIRNIRSVVTDAKINTPYVNIALPENLVYTKVLEMPVLSDKELSSAIYWEAEQYIPVPLPNVTLDFKVLSKSDPKETNAKMQVLLVAAPTALLDKYQKILEASGLILNAVETEILSVIRATIKGESSNSLIVHIGAVSTLLAIVKNDLLVFAYTIPTGGSAINRAIATDFGFTMEQAEEYKKTYGITEKTLGGKIGQATMPILSSILTEVKKALSFYNEKYKEVPIRQIILSGGSAKLPGLDVFFVKNCGMEAVIANPWKILADQKIPKDILENAPEYAIAVGLAMRDYERN